MAGTIAVSAGPARRSWCLAAGCKSPLYAAFGAGSARCARLPLKLAARSAEDAVVRRRQPTQTSPPLTYRLARWREERLVALMGWIAAISVLLAAGLLVGSL